MQVTRCWHRVLWIVAIGTLLGVTMPAVAKEKKVVLVIDGDFTDEQRDKMLAECVQQPSHNPKNCLFWEELPPEEVLKRQTDILNSINNMPENLRKELLAAAIPAVKDEVKKEVLEELRPMLKSSQGATPVSSALPYSGVGFALGVIGLVITQGIRNGDRH